MADLKHEHEMFCIEMSVDDSQTNQTKAYMRVYKEADYESARRSASRLMTNADIQERIKELREERKQRITLDKDKLLQLLYYWATADGRDMYRPDGSLIPVNELSPDAATRIQGFEMEELLGDGGKSLAGYVKKYKLVDRLKAADLVGKNLLLWKDVGSADNPASVVHKIERVVVKPKS